MTYLLLVGLVVAGLDWWAVYGDRRQVENVAKPLVMVALIVAVVASTPAAAGWLITAGLLCSLIGDLLLLPAVDRFVAGLAAFLVGHIFFVAGFLQGTSSMSTVGLVLGVLLSVVVVATIGRQIVSGAAQKDRRLTTPVRAYVIVLATMLIAGQSTGSAIAAGGAALFAASDAILGWNRFVSEVDRGRFWTHIPYHLGQGLIALWVIGL